MSVGCFIAGTDTGVGKTRVSVALCRAFVALGLRVAAMKPVASGAERIGDTALRNADAMALLSVTNVAVPYELANPYCFEPAVSPHLAARDAGMAIEPHRIAACYEQIAARADVVLVEGAGGWLAPIGAAGTMADIATALALPVVLVVGLRLGCLNHAALTLQAVRASQARLAGWIANAIDLSFERSADNVGSLEKIFGTPALGALPYGADSDTEAALLAPAANALRRAAFET
ncbi:MAG: dethiobiotin synthase [Steroidobacteraceae bacterium]